MQFDRVSFATATTGTGTITSGAATAGFRTMAAATIPDGTTVQYAIEDGTGWETGNGVVGASSTTLTRVLSQSSTGALLVLTGAAKCFLTPIASQYNGLNSGTTSVVFGRVRMGANQSIAAGSVYLDLVWTVAPSQVGGTFWTSGATVTIPETGYYQIDVEATFESAATPVTCNMQLLAGAAVIGDDERMVAASATAAMIVSATRSFVAGDTLKVQVKHSNATALNVLTQGDHSPDIRITKIGGAKGDATDSRETQFMTDFTHTNQVQNDFLMSIIGTGSLFTTAAVAGAMGPNHPGVVQWRSGTTAGGGVQCSTLTGAFRIGGGEQWDVNFYTAPVFTTITWRSGASDSITSAAPVDGVYFEMSASGAIVGKTMNNSVGSTTATLATLAASTYYHGRISINADATLVTFSVYSDAGALLGSATLNTNIPTANLRETGWLTIITSSGTVAIELGHLDRMKMSNPGRIVARGAL